VSATELCGPAMATDLWSVDVEFSAVLRFGVRARCGCDAAVCLQELLRLLMNSIPQNVIIRGGSIDRSHTQDRRPV
jgi:hypothetical protein